MADYFDPAADTDRIELEGGWFFERLSDSDDWIICSPKDWLLSDPWPWKLVRTFISAQQSKIAALQAEVDNFKEALTPSSETKAAYWGEFRVTVYTVDEHGDNQSMNLYVPWTTMKKIMAAILKRASQPSPGLDALPSVEHEVSR